MEQMQQQRWLLPSIGAKRNSTLTSEPVTS